MPSRDGLSELAWVATRCGDAAEFRAEVLGWIGRNIGVDVALLMQLDGDRPAGRTDLGLGQPWTDRFIESLGKHYRRDFEDLKRSFAPGRFTTGTTTRLERWAKLPGRQGLEEDHMFPLGVRIGSAGAISVRGAPTAILMLGRSGGVREFTPDEGQLLADAAPVFALGLALHDKLDAESSTVAAPRSASRVALTPREQSIVQYVVLGLTNRQIALALGTSTFTVRNQLGSIFKKLSVGSRAELTAVALTEALVPPTR